ncbi:hypothetical protein DIS24_g5931 [Lasiodiplodia hormozganensis]|uniref:Heme oxygenase-like protein n=1 Tax=Lasiodiplodia hormozganensis TaxID=869390 RepID=A0AA40CY66_9PEZI|nr:hypothetical protein DIS24_g5931 [Lasiodiplodia hormozganensis]
MTNETGTQPAAGTTKPLLSNEINTATRSIHTKLNKLITARLPLALPPHSASPRVYAYGLLHFAHVYLTFESAWQDLINHAPATYNNPALSSLLEDPWVSVTTPPSSAGTTTTTTTSSSSTATPASPSPTSPGADANDNDPLDPALLTFLRTLLPAGLPRSKRLRRDLAALLGLRPVELDVRLATAGYPGNGRVAAYAAHIRRATAARPHVLIAYAWVMYMAVFAGGRWIRGQLASGGREFWEGGDVIDDSETDKTTDSGNTNNDKEGGGARKAPGINFDTLGDRGLAFFSFDGAHDGEDIKAAFKARLEDAEALLSPRQRAEVVAEAHAIFEWSIALVEELDELLDTPDADAMPKPLKGHGRPAPVSEKEKMMMAEKGGAEAMAPAAARQQGNKDWVRQGGSIAGALVVLGGVYWWAAYCLGTVLREGWHEGWAGL